MSDRQHECAEALDALERKRAAGEMSAGEADVWRQRLLAESSRPARPTWVKALIVLAVVVVGIVWLRIGFGAVR